MTQTYIPTVLRQLVYERARGSCEYCLVPETVALTAHQVDHIIAQKHGGPTTADNLALSCALCNTPEGCPGDKHKGSDLASLDPETSEIAILFHPRRDRWTDHFQLAGARVVPLTPVGRATIRLLQLNQPERMAERKLLIAAGALHLPQ